MTQDARSGPCGAPRYGSDRTCTRPKGHDGLHDDGRDPCDICGLIDCDGRAHLIPENPGTVTVDDVLGALEDVLERKPTVPELRQALNVAVNMENARRGFDHTMARIRELCS